MLINFWRYLIRRRWYVARTRYPLPASYCVAFNAGVMRDRVVIYDNLTLVEATITTADLNQQEIARLQINK